MAAQNFGADRQALNGKSESGKVLHVHDLYLGSSVSVFEL